MLDLCIFNETRASQPPWSYYAAGTLTGAQYTQSFVYDALNQLTSSPLGSYTYGDSAHLHAAMVAGTSSSVSG